MSKINLPIAELKPALAGLSKIIQKRTTLPVLSCIRIDRTKDGWTTLTGTDLEAFVTVRLEEPAAGEQASMLVPLEDIAKITKGCSAGETITLEQSSHNTVTLHYPVGPQSAQVKITSLAVEEFPPIPRIKGEPVSLNDAIRTSLLEAMECASTDQTRQILQGAYLDVSDKKCQQIVGTDGRHLYGSNSFSLPLKESVIIPTNKFLGWKEFNADGEWQLRLELGKKKDEPGFLQISSRRWRFIHKQIEGNYPNWKQVIPTGFKTTMEFTSAEAASVVPRLPIDARHVNKPVGLRVEKNRCYLLGRSASQDKWTEVNIEGVKITGAPVVIYLNRDLLMKAFTFGFTKLEIVDEMTAMKFSSGGKYLIVMPVRGDSSPVTTPAKAPAPTSSSPQKQEPHDAGEASSANSENSNERSTMRKASSTPSNGNGTNNGHYEQEETQPVSIDTALEQIELVKGSYREAIRGLNTLTDTLKQVQRNQKTAHKEVQSVRSTLEKLQSVRI